MSEDKTLTQRERDLIVLLCEGRTRTEIGAQIGATLPELKEAERTARRKLGARTECQMIALYCRNAK